GNCPPLAIADLTGMDASMAPGFDAPGFRCKSMAICGIAGSCVYYANDTLGSLQSAETTYTDGAETATPAPVKLRIDGGAASQCNNPAITLKDGDYIAISYDAAPTKLAVYLPAFTGTSLTVYVASDGSTFYDAALTQPARLRP